MYECKRCGWMEDGKPKECPFCQQRDTFEEFLIPAAGFDREGMPGEIGEKVTIVVVDAGRGVRTFVACDAPLVVGEETAAQTVARLAVQGVGLPWPPPDLRIHLRKTGQPV